MQILIAVIIVIRTYNVILVGSFANYNPKDSIGGGNPGLSF